MTHPVTMAAKAPVKDALWTIRGRQFRNPQFGREVRSVLFLCHGNICRSPFAAVRAAQLLERAGIDDVHRILHEERINTLVEVSLIRKGERRTLSLTPVEAAS